MAQASRVADRSRGGGCSGFSYSMTLENSLGILDKTYNPDGFEVLSGKYISI